MFANTNNPWDLTRTPGGSSAGVGAALAAGLTPLDIGLDTLGSIQNPAHYCGVYGMRPTERSIRCDTRGQRSSPPRTPRLLDSFCGSGTTGVAAKELGLEKQRLQAT